MKKRFLAFVVFIAVLCMAFPAFAENIYDGNCGANLTWEYDTETKTLTISGTGAMSNFDKNSTGMIAPWRKLTDFDATLEKVEISEGVTSIGDNAFFSCESLNSVTLPSSVTSIGEGAFYSCKALNGITIPNGVKSIGKDAFQYCVGLKEVSVPDSVKSIGEGAFSDCYEEKRDDNNNIVSRIGLKKVTIQDGVEAIGAFAFSGCKKLNDVTLPDSVTSIGDNAFLFTGLYNDYTTWRDLYIGKHLIKADDWALKRDEINDYIIKPETKTIADNAFSGCGSLKSITIPDSVLSIGNQAFSGCSDLTSIEIPGSVTSIGNSAFNGCIDLTGINVADGNSAYCSENGILYNKEKTEIICFPKNKSDNSFEIPDGITTISDGAFERCWNLTNVTIPNGVKTIGDDAFNYCEALTSITIPDGVTSIGNYTFFNCSSLTSVTIPNSVISIGENAFLNCDKLKKVNYTGSMEEWKAIEKGKGYSIADALITYCSGISAKYANDGKIIIRPINTGSGKTVILALYDGDRFIELQTEIYDGNEIEFIPKKAYTCAKIMIWNNLNSMSPVCGAYTVK